MTTNSAPNGRRPRASHWLLLPLAILVLPLLAVALACRVALLVSVEVIVWMMWLPRGRDILLVYSNSPHWQAFFEREVLPRVSHRAVVLNWSERKSWRLNLSTLAFRCFAGPKNFNPIAFHFRPFRWHTIYRFYEPFRVKKADVSAELDRLMVRFTKEVGC